MKSLFVRLSVVALAFAGFTASTVISVAAPKSPSTSIVTPRCLPGSGDYCGLM